MAACAPRFSTRFASSRLFALAAGALLIAGCSSYSPPPDAQSGLSIAEVQAQNQAMQTSRQASRAPSQIQIATGGLLQGNAENAQCVDWLDPCWEAGAPAAATGLPQQGPRPGAAQTFRGTLPCQDAAMNCTAQHATLTVFPDRSWRARITYFRGAEASGKPEVRSGCWERQPEPDGRRFALLLPNGNALAWLDAPSNNVLQWVPNDDQPSPVAYRLTRQPDTDPISNAPATVCRKPA